MHSRERESGMSRWCRVCALSMRVLVSSFLIGEAVMEGVKEVRCVCVCVCALVCDY